MCGFLGAVGAMRDIGRLERSLPLLGHRGPDDTGLEAGKGWVLGFRRLSILDLKPTGHQPMFTPDRSGVLVFNGEIYNFAALRRELEEEGERFDSSGDAEVLLRLLAARGQDALPKLNGMFALAFLDLRRRTFLIARDRLGVKPLHYAVHDGTLAFASEIPALMEFVGPREVEPLALNRYLALGHVPPPLTAWRGVFKLPPGCLLEGSLDEPDQHSVRRWWSLELSEDESRDEASWLDELDGLLLEATKDRLVSDVPVGTFLSGGLDSGLVCHYAAAQSEFLRPDALTIAFDEEEYSETPAAASVAAKAGVPHHVVRVAAGNLAEVPLMAWHAGEPFGDASFVNQFLLARAAKGFATVFLTGDGGDEAFSGYPEYPRMARHGTSLTRAAGISASWSSSASALLPAASHWAQRLTKLSGGRSGFGALVRNNFRDPLWPSILAPDWRASRANVERDLWTAWEASAGAPLLKRMRRFDYECYLEPDVLVKVDRATMAHSIEARSPFLDPRVVEFAARIPARFHANGRGGKRLLKALARRHLPPELAKLPKRGFVLPIREWLWREPLRGGVREVLFGERARSRGWWNAKGLDLLLSVGQRKGGRDLSDLVWRALMLEFWARVFLDGDRDPWKGAAAPEPA